MFQRVSNRSLQLFLVSFMILGCGNQASKISKPDRTTHSSDQKCDEDAEPDCGAIDPGQAYGDLLDKAFDLLTTEETAAVLTKLAKNIGQLLAYTSSRVTLQAMEDSAETKVQMVETALNTIEANIKRDHDLGLVINQALCDRLQRVRSECPTYIRLIADGSESALSCRGGAFKDSAGLLHSIKVEISGGHNMRFVSEGIYKSTFFNQGTTEIEFFTDGSDAIGAPRIAELASLKLTHEAGSLPPEGFTFSLKVNEREILNQGDLTPKEDGLHADIKKIIDISQSATCKVSRKEIDKIKTAARAKFRQEEAARSTPPAETPESNGDELTPVDTPASENGSGT